MEKNELLENNKVSKKAQKRKKYNGFTLMEMLIVLLVIAVLILLFVPNLGKQKEGIDKKGNAAFEQVIKNQVNLYKLNETDKMTKENMLQKEYLTNDQIKDALAKNLIVFETE